MSILNQIPKPTINLDFVQMQENRNTLSALRSVVTQIPGSAVDFSALRASKKYTENRLGLITEAPLNVPALSFDGGVAKGFLAEGGATNLLGFSENFNNSLWSVAGGGVLTPVSFANPDGSTSGSRFEVFDSNSRIQTSDFTAGSGTYTLSLYVYGIGLERIGVRVVIDGTLSTIASKLVEQGRWTRITTTFTASSSVGNVQFRGSGEFTGQMYLWGAQLETGSFASSYIPTEDATASRSPDNFRITGASGAIGQTSGVIAVDVDWSNSVAEGRLLTLFNNINNRIDIRNFSTNRISAIAVSGGNTKFAISSPSVGFLRQGIGKVLLVFADNNVRLFLNSSLLGTNTTATFPFSATLDKIKIGAFIDNVNPLNDSIRSVKIWNTASWCTDEIAKILTRP